MHRQRGGALAAALGCAALAGGAGAADDPCLAAFKADEARIIREFSARPPGGETRAQQQWSREMHAALEEAAGRARRCQEDGRPKPGSAQFQRNLDAARECTARASRRMAEADARLQASSRDRAAQAAWREEQDRVIEERMRCEREAR